MIAHPKLPWGGIVVAKEMEGFFLTVMLSFKVITYMLAVSISIVPFGSVMLNVSGTGCMLKAHEPLFHG